jgi:hypothetical protein
MITASKKQLKALDSLDQRLKELKKPVKLKKNKNKKNGPVKNSRDPSRNPVQTSLGDRTVHPYKMEYIGDVLSGGTSPTYSIVDTYPVNPGQIVTFPWMSAIAQNYEMFRFKSLKFIYKPQVTEFTAGANSGVVIMTFDYNAGDPGPSNKVLALESKPSVDCVAYQTMTLVLDPKMLNGMSDAKFVRANSIPPNADIKTFDCGNLFVSTQGQTVGNLALGELYVAYELETFVPVLEISSNPFPNRTVSWFQIPQNSNVLSPGVTLSLSTSGALFLVDGIGLTFSGTGNAEITLPRGNYMFDGVVIFNGAPFTQIIAAVITPYLNNIAFSSETQAEWTAGPAPSGAPSNDLTLNICGFFSVGTPASFAMNALAGFSVGGCKCSYLMRFVSL